MDSATISMSLPGKCGGRSTFFSHICGALRDLMPCAQFKKHEKYPWRKVTFSEVATLLKVTLLHGFFSRFLNSTNGTKSAKAPYFCKTSIRSFEVSETLQISLRY